MNTSPVTGQRVALVTGGSRGIGRETALRLAADGYAIALVYAVRTSEASQVAATITGNGGHAIAVQANIADPRQVERAFTRAGHAFGGIDVVVNAAGIVARSTVDDLDLEDLDRVYCTNVRGAFAVSQQAARRLRGGGAIINFSTTLTRRSIPGQAAYTASKAAVESLTLILARELRGRDITVNAVAPGPTATEMFLSDRDEEAVAQAAASSPLGRLGTPADVADVVAFLAGPGRWVNGQVIYVNGGLA
jgi:3-oxoacyl-[acyl-carrier protein] reductase